MRPQSCKSLILLTINRYFIIVITLFITKYLIQLHLPSLTICFICHKILKSPYISLCTFRIYEVLVLSNCKPRDSVISETNGFPTTDSDVECQFPKINRTTKES
jgi:hypothetical protein